MNSINIKPASVTQALTLRIGTTDQWVYGDMQDIHTDKDAVAIVVNELRTFALGHYRDFGTIDAICSSVDRRLGGRLFGPVGVDLQESQRLSILRRVVTQFKSNWPCSVTGLVFPSMNGSLRESHIEVVSDSGSCSIPLTTSEMVSRQNLNETNESNVHRAKTGDTFLDSLAVLTNTLLRRDGWVSGFGFCQDMESESLYDIVLGGHFLDEEWSWKEAVVRQELRSFATAYPKSRCVYCPPHTEDGFVRCTLFEPTRHHLLEAKTVCVANDIWELQAAFSLVGTGSGGFDAI